MKNLAYAFLALVALAGCPQATCNGCSGPDATVSDAQPLPTPLDAGPVSDCAISVALDAPTYSSGWTVTDILQTSASGARATYAVSVPGRVLRMTGTFAGSWNAGGLYVELAGDEPLVRVVPAGPGVAAEATNPVPAAIGAMVLTVATEPWFVGGVIVESVVIEHEC